jgi:hypothetical protein
MFGADAVAIVVHLTIFRLQYLERPTFDVIATQSQLEEFTAQALTLSRFMTIRVS